MRKFIVTLLIGLVSLSAIPITSAQSESRQVYAYYFGWWTGESWNDGRLIDRPANRYDSRDGGAIGRHIDEAKSAGIDAFIMSWYGPKNGNLTHNVFNALLDQASARGFRAAVSLDLGSDSFNANADEVLESLRYLIGDRVNHPGYLRFAGKPVIYFWNQGRFSVADWSNIRAQVDPDHNTIWVMEGTNTGFLPVFDGLYLFNTAWSGNPAATASGWLANTRAAGGWFYTPTVLPGWDESRIDGRNNPTSPQDRSSGQFLTNSWNGAASSGAGAILIVSWNEYFENSHIEPSQAHGSQALDTLRPLIANWKAGGPVSVQAPAAEANNDPIPAGAATFTTDYRVNLRDAPSESGARLDTLPYLAVVGVLGRNADSAWVQVQYNGQTGWVAAHLGRLSVAIEGLGVTG